MDTRRQISGLATAIVGVFILAACDKAGDRTTVDPDPVPPPAVTAPAPERDATAGTDIDTRDTTVGSEVDDAAVTTKVKAALLADDVVKGFDVKVETQAGEVQLSGFVENQMQMDRAVEVTRGVEGVRTVQNNMTLQTSGTSVGQSMDDGLITTKIKASLLGEKNLESGDISVVTRNGEVQLSGFAENQSQIDRAVEVAKGVEGVRNVINEVAVENK